MHLPSAVFFTGVAAAASGSSGLIQVSDELRQSIILSPNATGTLNITGYNMSQPWTGNGDGDENWHIKLSVKSGLESKNADGKAVQLIGTAIQLFPPSNLLEVGSDGKNHTNMDPSWKPYAYLWRADGIKGHDEHEANVACGAAIETNCWKDLRDNGLYTGGDGEPKYNDLCSKENLRLVGRGPVPGDGDDFAAAFVYDQTTGDEKNATAQYDAAITDTFVMGIVYAQNQASKINTTYSHFPSIVKCFHVNEFHGGSRNRTTAEAAAKDTKENASTVLGPALSTAGMSLIAFAFMNLVV